MNRIINNINKNRKNVFMFDNDKTYTFNDLDKRSNEIQTLLSKRKENIIPLVIPKSFDFFASILACWKQGKSFIPIDPELPQDRIEYMRRNIKYELNNKEISKIDKTTSSTFIGMKDSDVAYIMHTSGSTGNPKGVIINFDSIVNYADGVNAYYKLTSEKDIILSLSKITFDAIIEDIMLSFLYGIPLICSTPNAVSMKDIMRCTIVNTTPSVFSTLNNIHDLTKNKNFKQIVLGGEKLTSNVIDVLLKNKIRVFNTYGPTEASVSVLIKEISSKNTQITLGKSINENIFCKILDENLNEDTKGELFIGGVCLARGYADKSNNIDNELTSAKFISTKYGRMYKTGDLCELIGDEYQYIGRNDNQIKINGVRIDLEEIEYNVEELLKKDVQYCIVIQNKNKLVCYYTTHNKKEVPKEKFVNTLQSKILQVMVPQEYIFLKDFPITQNGKKDRNTIVKLSQEKSQPVDIKTDKNDFSTKDISKNEIFTFLQTKMFSGEQFNENDDLFDLGLNSLSVISLASFIIKHYKLKDAPQRIIAIIYSQRSLKGILSEIAELNVTQNEIQNNNKKESLIKNISLMLVSYILSYSNRIGIIMLIKHCIFNFPRFASSFVLIEQLLVSFIGKKESYTRNVSNHTDVLNPFNIKVDKTKRYVLSEHPHGINSFFSNDETGICRYFHNHYDLDVNIIIPKYRKYFPLVNLYESICGLKYENPKIFNTHNVLITPGEHHEDVYINEPYTILISSKRGFFEYAIKNNSIIIPIYTFNKDQQWNTSSIINKKIQSMHKKFPFLQVPFYGKFGLPVSQAKPFSVIGKPIDPKDYKKNDKVDRNKLLEAYCNSLNEVVQKYANTKLNIK